MSDKKIIAVVGATGAQGGSLVSAILADTSGEFAVRAITRDVNSEKAKALAAAGAEVVSADVNDEASLVKALDGAYGAFFVTFFWDHFSPAIEKQNARAMASAAKAANVKHVIWSSLEDTRKWIPLSDDRMPTLQGEYKVPHFDAKGESNAYFTELGLPVTILNTSFYWENFIYFGVGPTRGEDGKLALTIPMADKRLPGIAVKDIGKTAFAIFKDPSTIGKTISIAGEHLTGQQMVDAMSKALGETVVYNAVPASVYRSFGFPGADDMGNMFQFKAEFEADYTAARDLDAVRKLNPELQSFNEWLEQNATKIPIA
jgi:uncharacterized protein YbjT (DUF2867 family)